MIMKIETKPRSTPYLWVFIVSTLGLAMGQSVRAQSALGSSVIASGGGFASGPGASISATVGQPLAGESDGLLAGFWQTQDVVVTGVEEETTEPTLPSEYLLHQNYPNPFNPSTTIQYHVKTEGRVKLKVFNALGQVVGTLVDEFRVPGTYAYNWNAAGLATGTYYYRLEVGGEALPAKKAVLLK